MRRFSGDQFRESSAPAADIPAENLPNLFPVEEWRAFYWTLDREGQLQSARASLHLPRGLNAVTPRVSIGESGVVEHVRRWGVTLRGGVFEDLGFDPTPFISHDRGRFTSDDAEALHVMTMLTHFDLPGFFIVASQEHPFLLFDPNGELKGSFTGWFTHAGALAYLVTDGKVRVSFDLVWEKDRSLYARVMQMLNEELAKKKKG
jgi:hypothetical protein